MIDLEHGHQLVVDVREASIAMLVTMSGGGVGS